MSMGCSKSSFVLLIATLLSLPVLTTAAQFVEVGASQGIAPYALDFMMGAGVSASDFDGDGDVDFFVPNAEDHADQLYLNDGAGVYTESAGPRGLASLQRARAALWLDIDGDADLDLLVAGDCFGERLAEPGPLCAAGQQTQRLYRQEANGQFLDVTVGSGLEQDSGQFEFENHRGGYAAGDLDNDGDLDLYAAHWYGPSVLYFNEGNGHFTEVTVAAGVSRPDRAQWQPVMFDADGDGLLDIFVAVDFTENFLFINQGNGQFVDRAQEAGVDQTWNAMGVALGDYDNDGDFDLYVTHIYQHSPGAGNTLLRNDSTPGLPKFVDIARSSGLADTDWGWGASFCDTDLDGDLDLVVTNGFDYWETPHYLTDQSRLFRNDGMGAFTDDSVAAGFNDSLWGSSVICFDSNGDGRPDLLQTTKSPPDYGPLRLLHNQLPGPSHYLRILPRSATGNTQAIGARVSISNNGNVQHRLITAGISFIGQEPAEALFGLGDSTQLSAVHVQWPDGRTSTLGGVRPDRTLLVSDDLMFSEHFE